MRAPRVAFALFVLSLFGLNTALPAGEIIELKSGAKIEGEVIKERANEIIVDIGIDILRIPLNQIEQRRKSEEPVVVKTGPKDGFYHVADLAKSNVRNLSAKYGEGVVMVRTTSGSGSGFIINEEGFCVTNHHVIESETRISVTIFVKDQDRYQPKRIEDVKIIALSPFFDLALLQIPKQKDLKFSTTYLDSQKQDNQAGEQVFAIGNPLGLERSVSEGIISTKNRNLRGLVYLQTTAPINPGNSGGPLFNLRGQVIGVTSRKMVGQDNLGFAIPISYVKHFLDNREAFAYDRNNPNNGYRYLDAPRRRTKRKDAASSSEAPFEE